MEIPNFLNLDWKFRIYLFILYDYIFLQDILVKIFLTCTKYYNTLFYP